MKKIHLLLYLALLLPIISIAQKTQKYNGPFPGGTATYSFYENADYERIYNGNFKFNNGYSQTLSGKFVDNKRNGLWIGKRKRKGYSSIKVSANYKKGKLHGKCSYIETEKGKIVEEYYISFKDNVPIGKITYRNKYRNTSLTLNIAEEGFINGKLVYKFNYYDQGHELIQEYDKGILTFSLYRNKATGEIIQKLDNRQRVKNILSKHDSMYDAYVIPKITFEEDVNIPVEIDENSDYLNRFYNNKKEYLNFPMEFTPIWYDSERTSTSGYSIGQIDDIIKFWQSGYLYLIDIGYEKPASPRIKIYAVDPNKLKQLEELNVEKEKRKLFEEYKNTYYSNTTTEVEPYSKLKDDYEGIFKNLDSFNYIVEDSENGNFVYILDKYLIKNVKNIEYDDLRIMNSYLEKYDDTIITDSLTAFRKPNIIEIKILDIDNEYNSVFIINNQYDFSDTTMLSYKNNIKEYNFNTKIHKADSLFSLKLYRKALVKYNELQKTDSSKPHPKEMSIKCIEEIYNEMISISDSVYKLGEFSNAKYYYILVNKEYKNKDYPKNQIIKCDSVLYEIHISIADSMYIKKEYKVAIEDYNASLEYVEDNSYPKDQLILCNAILRINNNNASIKALEIVDDYRRLRKAYKKINDWIDLENKLYKTSQLSILNDFEQIQENLLSYNEDQIKIINKKLKRIDNIGEMVKILKVKI